MLDTAAVIDKPELMAPPAVAAPPAAPSQAVRRAVQKGESGNGKRDGLLYGLIVALVLVTYGVTRLNLYTTKSDFAYWLGVAGGIGMLLLLSYTMR